MTTRAELEHAIDEDPDDDARRMVLADWLQQHGDPHGELAIVQHALATQPTEQLREREQALIEQVLGDLWTFVESSREADHQHHYKVHGMDPIWRLGFLDNVRISDWERLQDCAPEDDDEFDLSSLLKLVAAHPAARFLRALRFGQTTYDATPHYQPLLDALVECELPRLRSLELGALDFRMGEMELSWVALGNVGNVARRFPQLHELVLWGACAHPDGAALALGTVELPELRRFALRTTDLKRDILREIVAAQWPKLGSLTVWFGDANYGCEVTPDDVAPLLATPLPLTELGLGNCEFTDDLVEPLALSDVLPRLRTLDLSCGTLTDEGAEILLDHAQAFAHLDHLVLDRCHLSDAAARTIAGICRTVSVAEQRELLDGERFVAVHE